MNCACPLLAGEEVVALILKRKGDTTIWASRVEDGPFFMVEHRDDARYVSELIPSLMRQFKIDVPFDRIHLYNGSTSQGLSPEEVISNIAVV